MAILVKPPYHDEDFLLGTDKSSVFLAGSIEMGAAEDWQVKLTDALSDLDVFIFNPRREEWDSSWEQKISNPQFREQVEWELEYLTKASVIALYFDPNSKSPISLLELGLFADTKKIVVFCPEGFWRKGNVDIVCNWFGVKQVHSFDNFVDEVRYNLTEN